MSLLRDYQRILSLVIISEGLLRVTIVVTCAVQVLISTKQYEI